MNILVAQRGARHGYAIPSFFAKAGYLERFYTDICGDVGLGKVLARGEILPIIGRRLGRLAGRRLPAEIQELTSTFAFSNLRRSFLDTLFRPVGEKQFRSASLQSIELGRAMVRSGFGQATHLYSMMGEFSPLLVEADKRGIKVISDVYVLLSTEQIVAKERVAFPKWEPAAFDYGSVRRELGLEDVLLTRTSFFVCPAQAVQDDLVSQYGVERNRTAVVPYGLDPVWLSLQPIPQPERVLFAGTAGLRKGIHYLAMAAEKLHQQGYSYEFRVAGNVSPTVAQQPICKHLNFLGRIPRNEMHKEFIAADVFVLPTLAEGSAGVTYQALGAGVPVVTTAASGSVVRDGVDGYIVPERDAEKLASAIVKIVEDRDKRNQMSKAARERAEEFIWSRYGERLIQAIKTAEGL